MGIFWDLMQEDELEKQKKTGKQYWRTGKAFGRGDGQYKGAAQKDICCSRDTLGEGYRCWWQDRL